MALQARCRKCRIHYLWDKYPHPMKGYRLSRPPLYCPKCKTERLQSTTHLCKDEKSRAAPFRG